MRLKQFFTAAIFLLTWANAQAQVADLLRLLGEASYAYPQTQAAQRELEATLSEQKAANWQRYPTPSFVNQTPQDRTRSDPVSRIAIDQPLYAGGRIEASIDGANARVQAAEAGRTQVAEDTAARLITAWFDWQRFQARQGVLRESVEAHKRLKEQIERRAAQEVSPTADVTLATARLSQTRSDLAQALSATRTAYAQLTQLAGPLLPNLGSDVLIQRSVDAAQTPPSPDWRRLAVARDPLLAKLAANQQAAEADIRIKRSALYPAVSVRYENDLRGPLPGSRVLLQLTAQPGAGLSAVAGVDAAVARRESAIDAQRSAALDLQQAMDIDFSGYEAASEQLDVAKLLGQSTQEVADSYARQFAAGRKSWLDVLNAVREAVSARLTILDAQAQQGQTWWRLRTRALGLLPNSGNTP